MSEKEVRKGPKCGGVMRLGILSTEERVRLETDLRRHLVRFYVGGWALGKCDLYSDMIVPFHCENCGYIELYRRMKQKKERERKHLTFLPFARKRKVKRSRFYRTTL